MRNMQRKVLCCAVSSLVAMMQSGPFKDVLKRALKVKKPPSRGHQKKSRSGKYHHMDEPSRQSSFDSGSEDDYDSGNDSASDTGRHVGRSRPSRAPSYGHQPSSKARKSRGASHAHGRASKVSEFVQQVTSRDKSHSRKHHRRSNSGTSSDAESLLSQSDSGSDDVKDSGSESEEQTESASASSEPESSSDGGRNRNKKIKAVRQGRKAQSKSKAVSQVTEPYNVPQRQSRSRKSRRKASSVAEGLRNVPPSKIPGIKYASRQLNRLEACNKHSSGSRRKVALDEINHVSMDDYVDVAR